MRARARRTGRDALSVLLGVVAGGLALSAAFLVSTAGQTYLQVLFD